MFNKHSTEQDSHAYLVQLLRAGAADDGTDAHSDDAVNEMIARSEEELATFTVLVILHRN